MDIRAIAHKLRTTVVPHPYYELAYDRSYNLGAIAQPGSVITVVGPTRVGKTMLARKLAGNLVSPDDEGALQDIPIAIIDAAATDQGFISTKYLMLRLLVALEHPFYVEESRMRLGDSESMLRKRLVSAIAARKTKFIIVDEAHHLVRTKSNRRAEGVLDTVKSLGNETGCVIIFVGGYELLSHQFLSAHLNGRMTVIEFPNYGIDDEGVREFDRLLVTVDEWLPWSRGMSLYVHRDQIYEGSLGCYGQLIHWCISAIAEMKSVGAHRLKLPHFTSTRRARQVIVIRNDIASGKHFLSSLEAATEADAELPPPEAARAGRNRPGQRKPTRDPVGVET